MSVFLNKVQEEAYVKASSRSAMSALNAVEKSINHLKTRAQNHLNILENGEALRGSMEVNNRLQNLKNMLKECEGKGNRFQQDTMKQCEVALTEHIRKTYSSLCKSVNGVAEDWVGILLSWRFPLKKSFGDSTITGNSNEEVLGKVQPELDDLKGRVIQVLRGALETFIYKKYRDLLQRLIHRFNEEIVIPLNNSLAAALRQYNIQSPLADLFEIDLPEVTMQLADLPLPQEIHSETTVQMRYWWHWFFMVPYEEKIHHTHYELNPSDLRERVCGQIHAKCENAQKHVESHLKEALGSLFVPYFVSVNKALEDISADLLKVQQLQQQTQEEVDHFKKQASGFVCESNKLLIRSEGVREVLKILERHENV